MMLKDKIGRSWLQACVLIAAFCSAAIGQQMGTALERHPDAPTGGEAGTPPRVLSVGPAVPGWIVDQTGLSTIEIVFDTAIDAPIGSVRVEGLALGPIPIASQIFDPATNTLTVDLGGPLQADIFTVIVDYTITANGVALDGESGDPEAASFPSGDGRPGGQTVFRYRVLRGDANRDGFVNVLDVSMLINQIGLGSGDPGFDPRADLNGDGFVNVLDIAILSGGLGGELPQTDGVRPVVEATDPPSGELLSGDLGPVTVSFTKPIRGATLDPRMVYAVDRDDVLTPAGGASLSADGMSATFTFDPPLERCGAYTVSISPALGDDSGELLVPATPVELSGIIPAQAPTIDPFDPATASGTILLTGTAPDAQSVELAAPSGTLLVGVTGGVWSAQVDLLPNRLNTIAVTAITPCETRSAPRSAQIIQDQEAPDAFIDFPADGAEIQADTTDVAGRVSDRLSGFAGLTVTVNGQDAEVDIGIGTNGTFFLPGLALNTGGVTPITVEARDGLGNTETTQISVERVEISEGSPTMAIGSGNGQTGRVDQPLSDPITVRVLRGDGVPFAGKVVTFDVSRSNGRLSATPGGSGSMMLQVNTDSEGFAGAYWTLGSDAGCGNNRVDVTSRDIAGTVVFCASATPAPADRILIGDMNNQIAEAGSPLPDPLRVWVTDACNGVAGVPVTYTVVGGDGVFADGSQQITVDSGATGHAGVPFTLGQTPGRNVVEATFPGNPGLPATFIATGIERDLDLPTTFVGTVLDNANRPLGNARLELHVNGALTGEAFTDVDGVFVFTGIPDGDAHVIVDGATADTLAGEPIPLNTFPFVGYDLTIVPNAENRLPGPALLPEKDPANRFVYDGTQDVRLTVAGIEGLEFTVAAGTAVTLPDGTVIDGTNANSVALSLDQVHFDKIPMPLPDGASYPFAWTLQPKAATFDPPVAVTLPNMAGLEPGSIGYILQWDGEVDEFVITASGEVSEDGSVIRSDPGAGITVAGWGGACPPYPNRGDAENCGADEQVGAWSKLAGFVESAVGFFTGSAYDEVLNWVSLVRNCFNAGYNCAAAWDQVSSDDGLTDEEISLLEECVTSVKECAFSAVELSPWGRALEAADSLVERLSDAINLLDSAAQALAAGGPCVSGVPADERVALAARLSSYAAKLNTLLSTVNPLELANTGLCLVLMETGDILRGLRGEPSIDDLDQMFAEIEQLLNDAQNAAAAQEIAAMDAAQDLPQIMADIEFVGQFLPDNSDIAGCLVEAAGVITTADEFGGWKLQNIAADGTILRVGLVCPEPNGQTMYAQTGFFRVQDNTTTLFDQPLVLSPQPPATPVELVLSDSQRVLETAQQAELTVTGIMSDGSQRPLPGFTEGTVYASSNASVVAVDEDGLLSAIAPGTAFVVVNNQGVTAVQRIDVVETAVSTTVQGFVEFDDGSPVAGAAVTTNFGGAGITNADGSFGIELDQIPPDTAISVSATLEDMGGRFVGGSDPAAIVPDGISDAGLITLRPLGVGPLFPGQKFAAGNGPQSVSLGDLDGDGDLDMAVANRDRDDTSVLLNNGDGTFAAQTRYAAGDGPISVSLGDLDGDGDLDMAVANLFSDDTSVLLNSGDGTFAAQTRYAAGEEPYSVSLGDLDGDGDLDMAVANVSSYDMSVLLNSGDGTFAAQTRYAAGDGPFSVSLGDLDGDGDLDMAVANGSSDDTSVLLNRSIMPPGGAPIIAGGGGGGGGGGTPARLLPTRTAPRNTRPVGVPGLSLTGIEPLGDGARPAPPSPSGNARGRSIGRARTDAGEIAAIRNVTDGTITPLGTLGGTASVALAINDAGQVVGWSETADGEIHAFRYTPGAGMQDLGTLGGAFSVGMTLNASGDAAGFSDTPEGLERPFLYTDEDGLRDLGAYHTPAGPINTRALAISADGRMVAGSASTRGGTDVAILWTERTGVIDLNTLLPGHSPWRLRSADRIGPDADTNGVVVEGRGLLGGEPRAYRLVLSIERAARSADRDGDGRVDAAEVAAFIDLFTGGDPKADLNGDGVLDLTDITRAFDARQQEPRRVAE